MLLRVKNKRRKNYGKTNKKIVIVSHGTSIYEQNNVIDICNLLFEDKI